MVFALQVQRSASVKENPKKIKVSVKGVNYLFYFDEINRELLCVTTNFIQLSLFIIMKTKFMLAIRIFLQLAYLSFHQTNAAFSSLITFDVDGTLVKGSGKAADSSVHCRAFGHAVGKVLGKGTPTQLVSEVLPRQQFHGSTDGLILIRLAQAALEIPPSESFAKLDELMMEMYSFVSEKTDEEISEGINILPGVIATLTKLRDMREETSEGGVMNNNIACGLVTGNVEGIARRKMRAVGVWETGE